MQNDVSVFILEMRRFRESDINIECPFMAEFEDINLFIRTLREDIENIEGVIEVNSKTNNNNVTFEIKTCLTFEELQDEMKVYLSDHICYLRFINLFTKEIFGEIK